MAESARCTTRPVRTVPDVEPVARPTARVLLLDDADRLLLFRSLDDRGAAFWYPVGGRVEAGETVQDAAVRELHEETGLSNVQLGPEVWRRRHVVGWRGVEYDIRERWFIARVDRFDIDTSGFTHAERTEVLEHRWWSPAELANAKERLVPADLAARLTELLTKGPPAEPREVGI